MRRASRKPGHCAQRSALLGLVITGVSARAFAGPYAAPQNTPAPALNHPALLPTHLSYTPRNYWLVGLALEQYGPTFRESDTQLGLVGGFRTGPLQPNASLLVKPSKLAFSDFEDSRWLAGFGLRSHFNLLGREWSYGVSAHFEARLEDHFWLAFASPFQIGTVLLKRNSWQLEVFAGARRALGGDLIDFYLVDPNGVNNETAQNNFGEARFKKPWRGFFRIVFSRKVD